MGQHAQWVETSCLLPNGLLPNEGLLVIGVFDSDRWLKAEERTSELIVRIQPYQPSEERRNAVADYVQRLITNCLPCQVFTFGSVPLKTYLPDGDIDLTAFSDNEDVKVTWANQVRDVLKTEEKNENAEFNVKEVQYIQAEVKIIKCLVENIVVDISFNQLGGLCTLCFLEEVDHLINQNHLFKRSIILIKAWCYYESRILGAQHGLISTYALETLVLYIFHVFNNSFSGPLEVLYRFLEFFSNFDWDNYCVSLWGPVPIRSLPDVTAQPPRKDSGELLLSKSFLDACSSVYAVFPGSQDNQGQPFVSKHFNVIDPLRINNNLGRSVSKGNFFRIRSAFAFGAKRLANLLYCPKDSLIFEVNQFFLNTWDRYGSGSRSDTTASDLRQLWLSNLVPRQGSECVNMNMNTCHEIETKSTSRSCSRSQNSRNDAKCSRDLEPISRENTSNQTMHSSQISRNSRPENLLNDVHGKFMLARTRSSPEFTKTLNSGKDNISSDRQVSANLKNDKNFYNHDQRNVVPTNIPMQMQFPPMIHYFLNAENLIDSGNENLDTMRRKSWKSNHDDKHPKNSTGVNAGGSGSSTRGSRHKFTKENRQRYRNDYDDRESEVYLGNGGASSRVRNNNSSIRSKTSSESSWDGSSVNLGSSNTPGNLPFAFYLTGPPVPFFTLLPMYTFPAEESDSSNNNRYSSRHFDLKEGINSHGDSTIYNERIFDDLNGDFTSHWQNLQYGRSCQNPGVIQHTNLQGGGRPVSANMSFNQIMGYGPHFFSAAPVPNRLSVYQRFVDRIPKHRNGTGTYLPNHKVLARERYSSNHRRGGYNNYDRNYDRNCDREGNWNVNPKSRATLLNHGQHNKQSADGQWGPPYRHNLFRPNSIQSNNSRMSSGMYPVQPIQSGASSSRPAVPPVVMLYPYDHNPLFGLRDEQVEFVHGGLESNLGTNETFHTNEQRPRGFVRPCSPDRPSSPQRDRLRSHGKCVGRGSRQSSARGGRSDRFN